MTQIQYNNLELCNVDCVSSNVNSSQSGAMIYIFEERSSGQDDHQGEKSNHETRIPNPQSWA